MIVYATNKQFEKIRGKREIPIRIKTHRHHGEPQVEITGILSIPPRVAMAGVGWSATEPSFGSDEQRYNELVEEMREKVGSGITSGKQLKRVAEQLSPRFVGIFDRDEKLPRTSKKPIYAIKNTETRKNGGEHWLGVIRQPGEDLIYDSFGRQVFSNGLPLQTTERDAEQEIHEEDCGARVLAWLALALERGIDAAKNI